MPQQYSDYLYRKASLRKIPLGGTFELSPVCNFACRMCYVRKTPAQIAAEGKGLRDWREWLALAEACRREGTLYLLLTGGEPFLFPHFRELYLQLHRMGFLLSINSNGTLIDGETLAWLKEAAPTRVNVTLYGASPETYQRICGHADGYHRAVGAIRALHQAGIPVVINASMTPDNEEDLEAIFAFGRELGLNVRMATYMFPPVRRDREAGDSRFSPSQAAEVYLRKLRCLMDEGAYQAELGRQLSEAQPPEGDAEGDWGAHQEEFMRCRAGRSAFWISWDGTMCACGLTPFPVQVYPFQRDFRECWLELTDRVRGTSALRECGGCPHRQVCNPCAAMLYAETGDVNTRAPYLCQMSQEILSRMSREYQGGERDG